MKKSANHNLITCHTTMLISIFKSHSGFTPYHKNLSCYVCEPASINLTGRTYVQWEMENRLCEEPTENLIQQWQVFYLKLTIVNLLNFSLSGSCQSDKRFEGGASYPRQFNNG